MTPPSAEPPPTGPSVPMLNECKPKPHCEIRESATAGIIWFLCENYI